MMWLLLTAASSLINCYIADVVGSVPAEAYMAMSHRCQWHGRSQRMVWGSRCTLGLQDHANLISLRAYNSLLLHASHYASKSALAHTISRQRNSKILWAHVNTPNLKMTRRPMTAPPPTPSPPQQKPWLKLEIRPKLLQSGIKS